MRRIVMGLSGGMDSATLLGLQLAQGYTVYCCSFQYGSTHERYETQAAERIFDYYRSIVNPGRVFLHKIDISGVMRYFTSSLLQSNNQEVPEGHYTDESMRKTIVPGRNLIFASIMAGLAESVGAQLISLGVHAGDHHIYPDCRPEFIEALERTILRSTDEKVRISTPFLYLDKANILQIGYGLDPVYYGLPTKVPYHLTRTCYKNQPLSCGKCGSCVERLEAFAKIGRKDPIEYES